MKKSPFIRVISFLILAISLVFLLACDDDNDVNIVITDQTLIESDKTALLFMLEEEKLARDTYMYLDDLWSINQFANIKNSEQTHMNAIEDLLIQNNIEYTILSLGEFENQALQDFYNQFVIDGAVNQANALQIGATIEDLDIVDLQDYMNATTNTSLINVFISLQCGSRNHLRSFVLGIENGGNTYTPQFLSEDDYNVVISESNEQCI